MTLYTQSAPVSNVDYAQNDLINALLAQYPPQGSDNYAPVKWGSAPEGTGVTLSYSFPAANAFWSTDSGAYINGQVVGFQDLPFDGFVALTSAQQVRVVNALNAWSSVANITFQHVDETQNGNVGDLRIGASQGMIETTFLQVSFIPIDPNYTNSELAADCWLSTAFESWSTEAQRYWQMLDMIGGAIGIVDPGSNAYIDDNWVLPESQDNASYSVLAHDVDGQNQPVLDYPLVPVGPMLYDIHAIQYLYGPNTTFATGSDTYDTPVAGTIECIWDAGGGDVITAAGANGASVINLVAGTFSRLGTTAAWQGGLANNLSIAFNVTIEHAIGSDFADTIAGNGAANWLIGSGGADIIGGQDAADVIFGDDTDDTVAGGNDLLAGGYGDDYLNGGAGDDLVYGDDGADWTEAGAGGDLVFGGYGGDYIDGQDDPDLLFGGDAADALIGNAGDDALYGGDGSSAGDDWMFGDDYAGTLSGNDYMYGGSGADAMFAGGGVDVVYGGADNDYIDGQAGDDHVWGDAGDDLVVLGTGNDIVFGGSGNDALGGADGNDTLYGGDGIDALWGGAGADVLYGGPGVGDVMYGDAGDDTVVVMRDSGWDLLADWNAGDLINIQDFGITSYSQLTLESLSGGITHVSGPQGFNLNVALDSGESLTAADFLFA